MDVTSRRVVFFSFSFFYTFSLHLHPQAEQSTLCTYSAASPSFSFLFLFFFFLVYICVTLLLASGFLPLRFLILRILKLVNAVILSVALVVSTADDYTVIEAFFYISYILLYFSSSSLNSVMSSLSSSTDSSPSVELRIDLDAISISKLGLSTES